jgi:hypothetical protein
MPAVLAAIAAAAMRLATARGTFTLTHMALEDTTGREA